MKIGLCTAFTSPNCTPDVIMKLGCRLDSANIDSIWMGEHVVLFDQMEFPYPGNKDGKIPVPEGGGMLDPVAAIGFLASCTSKLRFGTGITLVPQRNPVYTAKEFATLDWLTNGRIDFGVGVGWCKEEVLACGYSWQDRGARCDEYLEVMQRLWGDELASFEGEHFTLPGCRMDPKPVQKIGQKSGLPIFVGGLSKPAYRRTARFGSGWYGFALNAALTVRALAELDAELIKVGRSRQDIEILITPSGRLTADKLRQFEDLGVDRLILPLRSEKPDLLEQQLDEIETVIS
ncbi:MAG: LLM class F420-dependent oxidoreductase [Pseudomonadales bacterium]|nr:LLM class F420-dependent oxidoreductase [Pseudomonadales bacterium]